MSNAVPTTGILVKRATIAAPTIFTTVAEIVHVGPPGYLRNKLETSTHNAGRESNLLGILRQKDPTFRINYVATDATHATLVSDIVDNVKARWQFAFPSGVTMEGDGYVQKFEPTEAPVDGIQQAECGLVWAGDLTLTVP